MHMTQGQSGDFFYFLNQKEMILVVTLNGHLQEAGIPVLEQCLAEVSTLNPKHVVLNFHNLANLENKAIRGLAQFQIGLRQKSLSLTVCGIRSEFTKVLDEYGAIRPSEVTKDLLSALQKIIVLHRESE